MLEGTHRRAADGCLRPRPRRACLGQVRQSAEQIASRVLDPDQICSRIILRAARLSE
jgi:hypothetical protein